MTKLARQELKDTHADQGQCENHYVIIHYYIMVLILWIL